MAERAGDGAPDGLGLYEEEDGEDLMATYQEDYAAIPELDHYKSELLDHGSYDTIDAGARLAAEAAISRRFGLRRHMRLSLHEERGNSCLAWHSDLLTFVDAGSSMKAVQANSSRLNTRSSSPESCPQEINIEIMRCPLRDWITQTNTRTEIKRRFRNFLLTYESPKGVYVYLEQIKQMCANNLASLKVSYPQLSAAVPILAMWTTDVPREVLEIFDEVAAELVLSSEHFPSYKNIMPEVHVRIVDLPILDSIQVLRRIHQNKLVRACGVVTRRSGTYPQLKLAKFTCLSCQALLGPFIQSSEEEATPSLCPFCRSNGPFHLHHEESHFRNYQRIALQELPGAVPPGHVPRTKEVVLLDDLIDVARPGEEVDVTGIFTHCYDMETTGHSTLPVIATILEGNHVAKCDLATRDAETIAQRHKQRILSCGRRLSIVNEIVISVLWLRR
mmetsp:Transcript_33877/g.108300  ORF Transcript_33877/g.108300 Transcript_33877/m.108300 type:complete len:446 (-) Transcript_33877:3851-5188(-)